MDDGFQGQTGAYSLLRDHQDSEVGSVQFFKSKLRRLDQHGIEIQVPSTSGDGSKSWIIKSRGPYRYVEESCHDPGNSPASREMVSRTSVGRPNAPFSRNSHVKAENTIESDELPFQRFYPDGQKDME